MTFSTCKNKFAAELTCRRVIKNIVNSDGRNKILFQWKVLWSDGANSTAMFFIATLILHFAKLVAHIEVQLHDGFQIITL